MGCRTYTSFRLLWEQPSYYNVHNQDWLKASSRTNYGINGSTDWAHQAKTGNQLVHSVHLPVNMISEGMVDGKVCMGKEVGGSGMILRALATAMKTLVIQDFFKDAEPGARRDLANNEPFHIRDGLYCESR